MPKKLLQIVQIAQNKYFHAREENRYKLRHKLACFSVHFMTIYTQYVPHYVIKLSVCITFYVLVLFSEVITNMFASWFWETQATETKLALLQSLNQNDVPFYMFFFLFFFFYMRKVLSTLIFTQRVTLTDQFHSYWDNMKFCHHFTDIQLHFK